LHGIGLLTGTRETLRLKHVGLVSKLEILCRNPDF